VTTPQKKWVFRAAFVAMFVAAAVLARSAPIASALLVAVPTTMFALSWWVFRGHERVAAAAKRGDLAALETIARTHATARYLAIVTLAMHGGVDRIRELGDRVFCMCGECELDANDRELDFVVRALRLVEAGHADRAYASLRGHKVDPDAVPPAPGVYVAVLMYAKLMSGDPVPADVVRRFSIRSLRPPIELALAQCLADRGKEKRAIDVLAGAAETKSPRLVAWRSSLEERLHVRASTANQLG
jgi:hypothetical protein